MRTQNMALGELNFGGRFELMTFRRRSFEHGAIDGRLVISTAAGDAADADGCRAHKSVSLNVHKLIDELVAITQKHPRISELITNLHTLPTSFDTLFNETNLYTNQFIRLISLQ